MNEKNGNVLNDRSFWGHSKGLGVLAVGNFFNSFGWGGVYAILIYYLYTPYTGGLGFTQGEAASLIAAMGACNGLFVIVGSWLADRVLGMRKALIIGNIVKAAAFGWLALPVFSLSQGRVFALISLFLMSLPIMGASSNSMTGQLYRKDDNSRRDAAFTIHTIFNNIGGMIAPIVVGFVGQNSYHLGFLISAVAALLCGLTVVFTQHRFFGDIGEKPVNPIASGELRRIGFVSLLAAALFSAVIGTAVWQGLLSFGGVLNLITAATFVVPLVFFTNLLRSPALQPGDRARMIPFFQLFAAQVVIALSGSMVGTAIAVFADAKTERHWFGITLAPSIFTSVYTFMGLLLSPVFVWLWTYTQASRIRTTRKFAFGMLLYGLAFGLLTIPAVALGGTGLFSPVWLIAYYFIMTLGDNLTLPIGSSITAKLSPPSYETQMQSAWLQAATIANGISILLFQWFTTPDGQMLLFPLMAVLLAAGFVLLLIFSGRMEKAMR